MPWEFGCTAAISPGRMGRTAKESFSSTPRPLASTGPGRTLSARFSCARNEEDRVVGVVDDVHEETVEGGTGSQIYYPATQQGPSGAQLVVRTSLPPATLAASVLRALRELNPKQPSAEFRPIQTIVDRAVSPRRFFMLLVAAFAGLGLVLAALGIYGVISYSVTQQAQAIGIRMALGASVGHVQRKVLGGTLRLAMAGMALGTLAGTRSRQADFFAIVCYLVLGSANVPRNGTGSAAGGSRSPATFPPAAPLASTPSRCCAAIS